MAGPDAREFCPSCGTPRTGSFRFCRSCGFDYDTLPEQSYLIPDPPLVAPPPPSGVAPPSPIAAPAQTGWSADAPAPKSRSPWLMVGVFVAILAILALIPFAGGLLRGLGDGSQGISPAGLPPAGAIWFGTTFDPSTMQISGQKTAVGTQEPFSIVAHLTRSIDASELIMRISLNGQLLSNGKVNASGTGDVWGFSPGPLFQAGTWRYELTDIGGNVLASGQVEAS